MKRYIEGESRTQATLLPELLDDYITEENPVRVIDVFVDGLKLSNLGFKTVPEVTGRPSYHPSMMLKLYIYGYLNRIQSSRRLENETHRNVELMWLLGRLTPDFKTIADFRKDNVSAIKKVCKEFVLICKKLNLFTESLVAIDGSKFKAVNNSNKNHTKGKVKSRLAQIETSIERYLQQIATADRKATPESKLTKVRLKDKIKKLKQEVKYLNQVKADLPETPDNQISLTDPDARSISTSGRGKATVGYNVQSAVDTEHHIIIAHEVTNKGHDRTDLANMSNQAKEVLDKDEITVVADRGYYSGEEIKACEDNGITTFLPRPLTSGSRLKGKYTKRDFIYHPQDDEYECPAGKRAIARCAYEEHGKIIWKYWSSDCIRCRRKSKCTTAKYRNIHRWEHEAILDEVEARLERQPEMMKVRRSTVEHPFGTIKAWMGYTHFQMKTLKRVSTEMSLHVLAYNLKRVMNIMGTQELVEAMQA